jgi:2-keto-4-pentenoate hydratase/2-oxohepta-3-ene-1,7-dioic acid hydratase in catechol pathway
MDFKVNNKTYTAQRVFCIGCNYVAHIEELNNDMPDEPVIFMKPATSLVSSEEKTVTYPKFCENLHFETELVILIGKEGVPADEADAKNFIAGLTVGLDLTMRDVQTGLREKSLSWEKCKAFDGSAPIGEFTAFDPSCDLKSIKFSGTVNGEVRQNGDSALMIFPITRLIKELSKYWKLLPGDVIYTGTPEGVGALQHGDTIKITDTQEKSYSWDVS